MDNFCYICHVNTYYVTLYTQGDELPEMTCSNFFHSAEFFHIIEKTPGQRPYMAVATDDSGAVVGHLLAFIRRRGSWLPPYLYTQGRIYGEGEYADEANKEEIFGLLLRRITRKLRRRLCLYIELSDVSKKMFGYKLFKDNSYFPIAWQEVHNSLHSMPPRERLTGRMRAQIDRIYDLGVETREARTTEEGQAFYRLLNGFYRFKIHRLIPPEDQINALYESENGRIFITTYKGKTIGGCLCVYTEGNAYLWYLASKRKSYALLHPNMMTVWQAIMWAWEHNYAHIYFLDVGLPYSKNPFRRFILSFGGKPVGKYRWFSFTIRWINRFCLWLYRE